MNNSFQNISMPQEIINSPTPKKVLEMPNSNSVSRNTLNNSNNPFTNSKTNYFKGNSSYGDSRNQELANLYSPVRQSMKEDDLDSQNMDDNLILKPHKQKNDYKTYTDFSNPK